MKDELVSFEVAKLAKEKGFTQDLFNTSWYNRFGSLNGRTDIDEKGFYLYYGSGTYTSNPKKEITKEKYEKYTSITYKAPTQSLLQRWLREIHKIDIEIELIDNSRHSYYEVLLKKEDIRDYNDEDCFDQVRSLHIDGNFSSYENALEEGLKSALELIK